MKLTLTPYEAKCLREAARTSALGDYSAKHKRALQAVYYRLTGLLAEPEEPLPKLVTCETPGGFRTGYKVQLNGTMLGSIWQEHMPRHLAQWWVIVGTDDRYPAEGISFGRRRDAIAHLVKAAAKRVKVAS